MRTTTLNGLVLVLGDQECHMCRYSDFPGQRTRFHTKPCPKCKGTGRRGNGKCRNCVREYSLDPTPGQVTDLDRPYADGPCPYCDGKRHKPATITDYLPADVLRTIVDTIGVRVVLRQGELSYGERLMGWLPGQSKLIALYSVQDYGRTFKRLSDAYQAGDGDDDQRVAQARTAMAEVAAEIGEKIVADTSTQACKLFTDDQVLATEIIVWLARDGYSVVAVPRTEADRTAILAAASVTA